MPPKYLSDDLITEILLKLPVKSLLRCQCVCKSWLSLISSQNFIRSHLNQSHKTVDPTTYDLILLLYQQVLDDKPNHDFHLVKYNRNTNSDQNQYSREVLFQIHPPGSDENRICIIYMTSLIGFSDGVMCILCQNNKTIMLCNTSLRKCVEISVPQIYIQFGSPEWESWVDYGFGHDALNDDYKIVCLFYHKEDGKIRIHIYSLKSLCWKEVDLAGKGIENIKRIYLSNATYSIPCLANGRIHWMAKSRDKNSNILLSFDLADEMFREIELPESVKSRCVSLLPPPTQNGMLSLSAMNDYSSTSIWVMREYGVVSSWTEMRASHVGGDFAIDLKNNESASTCTLSIYSFDGVEVILTEVESGGTKRCHNLEFHRKHAWFAGFANYMESLVLLNHGKSKLLDY